MNCNWCGLAVVSGHIEPNGSVMHNGCRDAKSRVESAPEVKLRKSIKPRPPGSINHPVDKPSEYYLRQLASFKKRMAKRGIKV